MLFIIFTANIPKFNSGCINFRGRNARRAYANGIRQVDVERFTRLRGN